MRVLSGARSQQCHQLGFGLMKPACFLFLLIQAVCSDLFEEGEERVKVYDDQVPEASGLTASVKNTGVFWTHNDLGNDPIIYAIDENQGYLGGYHLAVDVPSYDLEDIAVGPGPEAGASYVYVGDIGMGNTRKPWRGSAQVFRFKEPDPPVNGEISWLYDVDVIELLYPYDEDYIDCETLLVDQVLGELLLLRKQPSITTIFATPPSTIFVPGSFTAQLEDRGYADNGVAQITGGDISWEGNEIILKRSDRVFYFTRPIPNESVANAIIYRDGFSQQKEYEEEPQGEGITFSTRGDGYYTLSETKGERYVPLLFYERVGTPPPAPDLGPAPSGSPTTFTPTETPSESPTWAPVPPSMIAVEIGNPPPRILGRCEGDCDSDDDCELGLICVERKAGETVYGCLFGENIGGIDIENDSDLCVGPPTQAPSWVPSEMPTEDPTWVPTSAPTFVSQSARVKPDLPSYSASVTFSLLPPTVTPVANDTIGNTTLANITDSWDETEGSNSTDDIISVSDNMHDNVAVGKQNLP